MDIKAVAVDIDGTITTRKRRIPPGSVAAIRKVEERGIPVILASGNVLPISYGLSQYLGTTGPIVAENGGVLYYRGSIEILYSNRVSLEAYERIRDMEGVERLFTDRWRISEVGLKKKARAEAIMERIKDLPVDVVETGYAVHIMQKGMNKMAGVRKAAELLGIEVENILAIGDSNNDIEMLAACGMSGVPGHAPEEVKKVAGMVAVKEYAEGFIEVLERYGVV